MEELKALARRYASLAELSAIPDEGLRRLLSDRPHCMLIGPPGSGKSFGATLLARALVSMGAGLQRVHTVHATALFDGKWGSGALLTREALGVAIPGVLVVDDAHALTETSGSPQWERHPLGQEIVAALLEAMEAYAGTLVVILAGQPRGMRAIYALDPSLRDRMEEVVLPPYTDGQLVDILRDEAASVGVRLEDGFLEAAEIILRSQRRALGAQFGNARAAKRVLRVALEAALHRYDPADLVRLRVGDLSGPAGPADAARHDAGAAIAQLDKLVGLDRVKREVGEIAAQAVIDAERARRDLPPSPPISRHLAFFGPPGTGKTRVATILGEIYAATGVLRRGHVHVVGGADLNDEGGRARAMREAVDEAAGGVLFIDEAYVLAAPTSIAVLVELMEARRDDLVVILAGYPREMEMLLARNTGLRDRLAQIVPFAPYTVAELGLIADEFFGEHSLELAAEARSAFDRLIAEARRRGDDGHFANARTVRKLVEAVKARQAMRLHVHAAALSDADLLRVEPADVHGSGQRIGIDGGGIADRAELASASVELEYFGEDWPALRVEIAEFSGRCKLFASAAGGSASLGFARHDRPANLVLVDPPPDLDVGRLALLLARVLYTAGLADGDLPLVAPRPSSPESGGRGMWLDRAFATAGRRMVRIETGEPLTEAEIDVLVGSALAEGRSTLLIQVPATGAEALARRLGASCIAWPRELVVEKPERASDWSSGAA